MKFLNKCYEDCRIDFLIKKNNIHDIWSEQRKKVIDDRYFYQLLETLGEQYGNLQLLTPTFGYVGSN